METKKVVFSVIMMTFFILLTVVALPLNVGADEIRIESIDDEHIGKEVTVSGVIIAISSNIEPSASTDVGIQTYEPGDTSVLTIDDGTDTIFVSSDPRLSDNFYKGQRVMVTGIYAGKVDDKGIIYADTVSADAALGYTDVTIAELKEFPGYYHAHSVCINGNVTRIELTQEETELTILDDDTGTMDVEYRAGLEDIAIGDEVVVEGKFYRNKIYAFAVKAEMPEPEVTPEPSPTSSPTPTPSPTPAPTNETTPTSSSTPIEAGGMSIFHTSPYLIVIVIAVVVVAGVFITFKVREWLMLKRYGK
ncbi:MAG: hypothetical protein JJE19_06480 [Methanosarcinales archaeon]|nr:hypothetical protein [Methanosarcinales archaeon]